LLTDPICPLFLHSYCHDCLLLCGRVVGNDPDGALDEWAHDKRVTATKQLLRARFEREVDLEVWRFAEAGDARSGANPEQSRPPPTMCMSGLTVDERYEMDQKKKLARSHSYNTNPALDGGRYYHEKREDEATLRSTASSSKKRGGKNNEGVFIHETPEENEVEVENTGPYTIRVRTLKGSIYTLTVNRDTSVFQVKTMIQQQYGIPEEKQHLLFYGKVLEDRKTLGESQIPPESGLQLLVRSRKPLDMSAF